MIQVQLEPDSCSTIFVGFYIFTIVFSINRFPWFRCSIICGNYFSFDLSIVDNVAISTVASFLSFSGGRSLDFDLLGESILIRFR